MSNPADDFAAAWARGGPPPDLAAFVPDGVALRTGLLLELIRVDRRNRARVPGLTKPLTAYRDEFPELPDDLETLLDGEPTLAVSTITSVDDDLTVAAADPDDRTVAAADDDRTIVGVAAQDLTIATITAPAPTVTTVPHDPATADPLESLDVGQRVDEFDLLTPLGSGAFARVFLARQRSMQRLVAVKISENRGTEPQTLAQLDHDYIVRVFDQRIARMPDTRRSLRLLYMQYLPGGTLLDVIRMLRATTWTPGRTGRLLLDAIDHAMETKGEIRPADSSIRDEIADLTWPETVAWLGTRLAQALEHAGSQGVLHRDIKPANVLLTAEGVPKLADFNISYAAQLPDTVANAAAYFGGSLAYMSPEQLAAVHPGKPTTPAELDIRSDIYSLGVVLWELLTTKKPFPASDRRTLDDMLDDRLAGLDDEALADLPPDTPATLRRILLTCLAPDPTDRWRTGADLAQQFELCLDPHARDLVDPPPNSWRLRARKWRVPIIVLCTLLPNIAAAIYNIQQNTILVFDKLSLTAQIRVNLYASVANPLGFGLGAIVIAYLLRRILRLSPELRTARTSLSMSRLARFDALHLGDRVVVVTFSLWMFFGMTFPFIIHNADPTVPIRAYVHFLIAQAVCAAMAVAYPFFLLTFFSIRSIYPAFLPYGSFDSSDEEQLRALQRRGNLYLIVAASVPLIAVAGVTFLTAGEIELVIVAVRVVCVGGIVAFLGAYYLFRQSERDMQALAARARAVTAYPE